MRCRTTYRAGVAVGLVLWLTLTGQLFASESDPNPEGAGVSLAPKHAFRMDRIEIAPIHPFSAGGAVAVPKEEHTFVIVLFGPITPDTQIEPKHLEVAVLEKQKVYKPLAFGFALANSKSQLLLIGRLTSGDMKIVGPKECYVGLIYELPKGAKSVEVRSAAGKETKMSLDNKYRVPDSARISNLLYGGRLQQDKYRTEEKEAK